MGRCDMILRVGGKVQIKYWLFGLLALVFAVPAFSDVSYEETTQIVPVTQNAKIQGPLKKAVIMISGTKRREEEYLPKKSNYGKAWELGFVGLRDASLGKSFVLTPKDKTYGENIFIPLPLFAGESLSDIARYLYHTRVFDGVRLIEFSFDLQENIGRKRVNGYDCSLYRLTQKKVLENSKTLKPRRTIMTQEFCISRDPKPEMQALWRALDQFREVHSKSLPVERNRTLQMVRASGLLPDQAAQEKLAAAQKKIDEAGVILSEDLIMERPDEVGLIPLKQENSHREITKITVGPIAPDLFVVPSDYAKDERKF